MILMLLGGGVAAQTSSTLLYTTIFPYTFLHEKIKIYGVLFLNEFSCFIFFFPSPLSVEIIYFRRRIHISIKI